MSPSQNKGFFRKVLFFVKLLEIRLRFVVILVVTALVVGYWDNVQNYYERWQRAHSHLTISLLLQNSPATTIPCTWIR